MKIIFYFLTLFTVSTLVAQQSPIQHIDKIVPRPGTPVWNLGEAEPLCPDWEPTSGTPFPLSIKDAVNKSRNWLSQKYPKVAAFEAVSISLRRLGQPDKLSKKWCYSIEFRELQNDQLLRNFKYSAIIAADGTIIEPEISK